MPPVNWQRLALSPDFQGLFTNSEGNPLLDRVRVLESDAVDLRITDPIRMTAIKGELTGIRLVEKIVRGMAEKNHAQETIDRQANGSGPTFPTSPKPDPDHGKRLFKFLGKLGT